MSRTIRAHCGSLMGHPAAWLPVGLAVLACSGSSAADTGGTSKWPPVKIDLFHSGKDGYTCYRIPAMVVTKRGVVLVFCAARKGGGGDWDPINIAMRRSTDGGRTWQPRQIIAGDGKVTTDNPTPIVDRQTGSVHFLHEVEYARCYYLRSDDDGQTWTAPVDITPVLEQFRKEYDWHCFAPGPGHAIQLDNGRVVVPVWLSTGIRVHGLSCMATIYSDDHGATWHRGEIVGRNTVRTPKPNESVAVQLSDGRVMLNIRSQSPRLRRLVAVSPDGATHWTEPAFDEALFDPICMAGMLRIPKRPGDKIPLILFSNPDSRSRPRGKGWGREDLSIKVSEDDGRSWAASRVLEPGDGGYSDMAVAPDGSILCLYERWPGLTLARFPISWIYGDPQEQLAKTVHVGDVEISTASPPAGLVVRRSLGLLTAAAVDGQVVHRARLPSNALFETRATKTPGGDYLLMFPDGGHYGFNKKKVNDMLAYRSSDQGRTWTGPTLAYKINYNQHGFIPLIPHGSKRIYCFGTQPMWDKFEGTENAAIGYRFSDDDGRTWSDVRLIEPANDPQFMGMAVMRMCETDRGTWMLVAHTGEYHKGQPPATREYVLRSEDQGKTWTALPGKRPGGFAEPQFNRLDEGRVIELAGGRALILARTMTGRLWELRSEDDGRTWSAPKPTSLVHPDAPPMVFHLADGETLVALIHNVPCHGAFNGQDRAAIWASLSSDEGRTWSEPRLVFANALEPGKDAFTGYQCSYVDAFADGGELHIFVPHRWQRVLHLHLKEADLRRLPAKADLGIAR